MSLADVFYKRLSFATGVPDKLLPETGVTGTVRSGSSNTILSERMSDPSELDGLTSRSTEPKIKHVSASSTETRAVAGSIGQIRMPSFQGGTCQSRETRVQSVRHDISFHYTRSLNCIYIALSSFKLQIAYCRYSYFKR